MSIRNCRIRAGMSARELADAVGVSASCEWQWESGHVAPRYANIMRMCHALGVDHETLMAEEEDFVFNPAMLKQMIDTPLKRNFFRAVTGASRQNCTDWRKGVVPTIEKLRIIAEAYDREVYEFFS